jgi:hypothetical protein
VPHAPWTNALQAYACDVIDEGPDRVVAGATLAAADTVLLLVSARETAGEATPHNPNRKTHWGEAFFPPARSRYPEGLVPSMSDSPESDGKAAFQALQAAAGPAGVHVVPFVHLLTAPRGTGSRNRTINVRGEFVGESLCPNGPESVAYAAALTGDCVEQFQASAVYIDVIRFTLPWGGIRNACACFCDGCFDRARTEGLDLEQIRLLLLGWVDRFEQDPAAAAAAALDAVSSAVGGIRGVTERPVLLDWLRFRHRTITRLIERIRGSIPDGTELWLDTWAPTPAWLLGQDLQALAPLAAWIKPTLYHQRAAQQVGGLIRSLSDDARTRQMLYEAYLGLLGFQGPGEFDRFAERGLYPPSVTAEMALAKTMLRGRSKLAAGVGIWGIGPAGVREILAHAAAAEPDGIWMHNYAWATMDELAAAGKWLREHGRSAQA